MAWNGSGDTGRARTPSAPQKKSGASSPLWLKGALAGLVVVAIGAVLLCVLRSKDPQPKRPSADESNKRSVIHEVKTPVSAKKGEGVPVQEEKMLNRIERNRMNPNIPHPGVGARIITNDAFRAWGKQSVFKFRAEREIANLLMIEPGTPLIGERHFRGTKFERDLETALQTPIEYDKDDDEQTKRLKIAVQQTKDYLKEQRSQGEDVCGVLEKTYHELQDLGVYCKAIKGELKKIRLNEDSTEADIEDSIQAANVLLEKKGIAPIRLSTDAKTFLRHGLSLPKDSSDSD